MSCSGVFPLAGGVGVAASSTSVGTGLLSDPTTLGIRTEPSVSAVKFMPMKRRIMSCVTCGTSKPTICDALKIYCM